MSEELLQRDLINNPEKIGKWSFYNIGNTSIKKLKEHGIIQNKNYGKIENKKVDAILVKDKNVIAIIENKSPSNFNTPQKKEKAIKQEIEVAKKLDCKLIIATDTIETVWINVLTENKILDENNVELKYNFNPNDEKLPEFIEKIIISINEKNDRILPKNLINPTDLAKQIWQDIWSVSGATPENCLYTFVELFIFKYLSDLNILQGTYNFYKLYDNYKIDPPGVVLETYADKIRPQIKQLFKENPIDKTTIINGTIFVSKDQKAVKGYSAVFKKILERFNNYGHLENIDYDFKSKLFESFLKESISKKNWGQFFTPLKVVRAMVKMAETEIKEGISICDPACGVGKFLLEPIASKIKHYFPIKKGKIESKITIHGFDKGFDKDEQKTIILAKANMLIYFSELIKENSGITKEFSDLFNESFLLKTNSILGTLSEPVTEKYNLILTNPPYVTNGSSNLKDEIKKDGELVNHYKVNAMGVEGLFMEWIIRALKKGGKAFIVVPDGIFNRQNDKNLRQFILDECYIDGIISLPEKTFFSTPKKTYILCITKKINKNEIQTAPVFTYLVSEIGESRDVYRFNIEQDDLNKAVSLYSFFKGNKTDFYKINTDKRCKIQPIEMFNPEAHWLINNWWNDEEKIELGIVEENKTIKFCDIPDLLNDISENLKESSNTLKESTDKNNNLIYNYYSIEKLFEIKSGNSKLIKNYLNNHKGEYVVYSANTKQNGVFGYIDSYAFDIECLQMTSNGNAGVVFYRKKHKFSINGDARILIKKHINLDYQYLLHTIQNEFNKQNFNWGNKATKEKIKNIEIPIPVNSKGEFNLEAQKEIAEKYASVEKIKEDLKNQMNNLLNIQIEI